MDAELKAKWVAALRSGKFQQGRIRFEMNGKYCCLGVLCEVAGVAPEVLSGGNWRFAYSALCGVSNPANWPAGTADVPMQLADMNDGGATFAQIADYIETNL